MFGDNIKRCRRVNLNNELYIKYHDEEWCKHKYDDNKINELLNNKEIIKIKASINNSIIFKDIQKEYGTFSKYIWSFTNNKIVYEDFEVTTNELSDTMSKDLMSRVMRFVGSTIIYSYLQAIGIISSHSKDCFCYKNS